MAVTVGSTPGELDLVGKRGDKWGPFEFTPRTPIDLSGRTWLAQVRPTRDESATVLATMVIDTTDAASGIIRATILPAESINFATGPDATPTGAPSSFQPGEATYYYDIQATLDTDPTDVKTWFSGKVKVKTGDMAGAF